MRETWIDRWRGILIFQIVVFHVVGVAMQHASGNSLQALSILHGSIESYHVMAFFAVTGVVWKTKTGVGRVAFIANKAKRLLIPYLFWGFIWAVAFFAMGKLVSSQMNETHYRAVEEYVARWWHPFIAVLIGNGWPQGEGWRVINALWFLPHMFFVSVLYFTIDSKLPRCGQQMLACLVLFAVGTRIEAIHCAWPWRFEWIYKSAIFLIFSRWSVPAISRTLTGKPLTAFFGALLLYAIFSVPWLVPGIARSIGFGGWGDFMRSMVAIVASALLAKSINWGFLETAGKASLGILAMHKFFILVVQVIPTLCRRLFGGWRLRHHHVGYGAFPCGDCGLRRLDDVCSVPRPICLGREAHV